jgi:prepilin-type N-terminal cleavage/methylation domain-containing protein
MRSQRGFSIVELMIAVAIVGVLAKLALPMFFSESRKSKARSEVSAMFVELATKEQQYRLDNAGYLAAVACPSAPSPTGQSAASCTASGGPWFDMRVLLPDDPLYCSYEITAGDAGTTPSPPAPFAITPDVQGLSWYYIIATCNMDDSSTATSAYFTSSWDTKVRSSNEGD